MTIALVLLGLSHYPDAMGFFSRLLGRPSSSAPRIVAHEAFDGAIRVIETPTSPGWQFSEDHRQGDGFIVMVLKYIFPMSPVPLALLAKIYAVDDGRQKPQDPRQTDWREVFQPLFSSFTAVQTHPAQQLTMKSSLEAMEAVIDGVGAEPAVSLRVRERRAVAGQEQFIVTAMGTPGAFEEHASEIESWFSTSAFVPIGDSAEK